VGERDTRHLAGAVAIVLIAFSLAAVLVHWHDRNRSRERVARIVEEVEALAARIERGEREGVEERFARIERDVDALPRLPAAEEAELRDALRRLASALTMRLQSPPRGPMRLRPTRSPSEENGDRGGT
jgi:hypothetical protein